jgi:hypothetical protein
MTEIILDRLRTDHDEVVTVHVDTVVADALLQRLKVHVAEEELSDAGLFSPGPTSTGSAEIGYAGQTC